MRNADLVDIRQVGLVPHHDGAGVDVETHDENLGFRRVSVGLGST